MIKRSEKHGFKLHVGTHIYKKLNKTVDNNGTVEEFETFEKVEPMTGDEIKLGIARHLYKTGVSVWFPTFSNQNTLVTPNKATTNFESRQPSYIFRSRTSAFLDFGTNRAKLPHLESPYPESAPIPFES